MTVEERKALIEKYQKLWADHKVANPSDIHIEAHVRSMAGFFPRYGDKPEDYPVLCIPVAEIENLKGSDWWFLEVLKQYDDLKYFGTRCGRIPDAYTVLQEAIDFLASFKIGFIVGCVPEGVSKDNETEYMGIPLGAMAFRADGFDIPIAQIGEAFAYFINQHGGSLRCEHHEDWCIFESE